MPKIAETKDRDFHDACEKASEQEGKPIVATARQWRKWKRKMGSAYKAMPAVLEARRLRKMEEVRRREEEALAAVKNEAKQAAAQ